MRGIQGQPPIEHWTSFFQPNVICSKYQGLDGLIEITQQEYTIFKKETLKAIDTQHIISDHLYNFITKTAILNSFYLKEEFYFIFVEEFDEIISEIKQRIQLFPQTMEFNMNKLNQSITQAKYEQSFYHRFFSLFTYALNKILAEEVLSQNTTLNEYFNYLEQEAKFIDSQPKSKQKNILRSIIIITRQFNKGKRLEIIILGNKRTTSQSIMKLYGK